MALQQSLTCLSTFYFGDRLNMIKFSPDSQYIVTCNYNKKINLWDAATGTLISTFEVDGNDDSYVHSIAFNLSGDLVAIGMTRGTIKIWCPSVATRSLTLVGHSKNVTSVSFSPRDTIASASEDKTIQIWNVATGTCLRTLHEHKSQVNSVAYSLDGKRIVSVSSDKTVKNWDVDTGTCLKTFYIDDSCLSIAFSPDDHDIVAVSNNGMIRLNARTGKVLLQKDIKWFRTLNFVSSCGHLLVVSAFDTEVMIWDSRTGACLAKFSGHNSKIYSIVVSPSGDKLAAASVNGTTTLWDFSAFLPDTRVLALALSGRRRRLPHIPQELWKMVLDEFY